MTSSKIAAATDEAIERAAMFLRQGELVGIPTETVYGLAANALDAHAVSKIYQAKGRPSENPLIVHIANVEQLSQVVSEPLVAEIRAQVDALAVFWPGPLTLVLPRNDRVPDIVTAGRDTVAVRIPAHPVARRLLEQVGLPLAAPSANRSTYVSPTTAAHVDEGLRDWVAMILDGGACECGLESTIVRLDGGGATILRPGSITREEVAARLGQRVDVFVSHGEATELIAPGMMHQHYAPATPIRMLSDGRERTSMRCGRIAFGPIEASEAGQYAVVEVLSATRDLREVAQRLFFAIRKLDGLGLDLIIVDECASEGVGQAIMDRLTRATAKF